MTNPSDAVDLRRLGFFIAVCDHGAISRAADIIGIAQPALSRQIQLLEKEVGLTLIHRSGRGAEPSQSGRFLLERSRAPFASLQGAVRELREAFAAPRVQVCVGICPSVAPLLLERLKDAAGRMRPPATLTIVQATGGDLRKLARAGRLDLAIASCLGIAPGLRSVRLLSESFVAAGRADAMAAGPCTLADLAARRLVLPRRSHDLRRIIDHACRAAGVRLRPALELDTPEAAAALLLRAGSRWITLLPACAGTCDSRLVAQPIAEPLLRRTVVALMRERAVASPAIEALLGVLRDDRRRVHGRAGPTP